MAKFHEFQREVHKDASKIEDDLIAEIVQERYEFWLDQTFGVRSQWRMNALMARGFQWAVMNAVTQRIVHPYPPRNRTNLTINVIKPWLFDTEAKLDISAPTFDVTPDTLSQEDKDAAIAGESIGQHYWRKLRIRPRYREISRNCLHFGNCLGVLDWDETIGPQYQQGDILETKGDISLKIYPPWAYFTDELPGVLDDKLYLGLCGWMPLDLIRQRWEAGDKVEPEGMSSPMDDVSFILSQMMSHGHMGVPQDSQRAEGANVYKFLMPPQKSMPNGAIFVVANGEVLEKKPWPEAFKKMQGFPAVDFHWYVHPSQFRGTSPIEDQIPLQREINKTASQIRENMDTMLALKWMNPIGSGVDDIDDLAGQIVDYMPGFMPSLAQPGSLPAYVFKYLAELFLYTEDVQMLHKPSKGKVPAGVKSGVGIELLQEQDDRPLSIPEADLHDKLTLMFRKILQIVAMAVEEDRAIEYAGPNRKRAVRTFKGADLRDNTDIHLSVVGGSTKSKPAMVRKIMDMVQVGLLRDKKGGVDTSRVLEMIRHAVPDVIYEDKDVHAELARDENDNLWSNGPVPPAQEWEHHFIHLDEHEKEMNTAKWKELAFKRPEWAKRWMAHRMSHIQLAAPSAPETGAEAPAPPAA